ncbi:hypothetical protein [Bacillus paralicheniformis]|uniref:hypothetical protein n=1 Tax=Bacillus paralicheniformis TaxID=1648923 RepID=UPI003D1A2105
MEFKTVTVAKKRFGLMRITSLFIGIFLMLISAILVITIIGILPGFGLALFSLPFFAAALGGAKYTCPNCGFDRNFVTTGKINDSCKRCRQNIAVDWVKPNKKNKAS